MEICPGGDSTGCGPVRPCLHDDASGLRTDLAVALSQHYWVASDEKVCSCGWVPLGWTDTLSAGYDISHHAFHDFLRHQADALLPLVEARLDAIRALCVDAEDHAPTEFAWVSARKLRAALDALARAA